MTDKLKHETFESFRDSLREVASRGGLSTPETNLLLSTFDACLIRAFTMEEYPEYIIPPRAQPGVWKHYKGSLYTVIGTARHHETNWPHVVYVPHDHGGLTVRPLAGHAHDPDGFQDILPSGKPRFVFAGDRVR